MRKFMALLICGALSACANLKNESYRPHTPARGIMLLGINDAPNWVSIAPVTFDNREMEKADASLDAAPYKPGSGDYEWRMCPPELPFCFALNLVPGRYHVNSFGYGVCSQRSSCTVYNLSGPKVSDPGMMSSALGSLTGNKPETIYNAQDLYFVVPPGGVAYLGNYRWQNTKKGFDFNRLKEPGELEALRMLRAYLANPPTLKALGFELQGLAEIGPTWLPLIDRRIAQLTAAPRAAPAVRAPAPVPELPKSQRPSPKKKKKKR